MAAYWPDTIKSDANYLNDGERPGVAEAAQNIGYEDHFQHRYWHFVDMPLSIDNVPGIQPATPNVETQIRQFKESIKSESLSDDIKSYDLV